MPPDQVYGLMATGPDNEKPGAVGGNEGRKVSEVNVGHMIPAYQTVTVSGLHPMRLFENAMKSDIEMIPFRQVLELRTGTTFLIALG